MNQETKEWLDVADTDLGVAKHLMENYYPKPLEVICYHCQQAVEKAIKAIVVSRGTQGGLPKLHDLSFLLNHVKNFVHIEEKYYDYADTLTPYGVSVRYPNELFLEEHHARNAIRYADEIVEWAHSVVENEPTDEN
jgi:HEPN domain-containing protein